MRSLPSGVDTSHQLSVREVLLGVDGANVRQAAVAVHPLLPAPSVPNVLSPLLPAAVMRLLVVAIDGATARHLLRPQAATLLLVHAVTHLLVRPMARVSRGLLDKLRHQLRLAESTSLVGRGNNSKYEVAKARRSFSFYISYDLTTRQGRV